MESFQTSLRRSLKDARRVAVLAIGSPLRGDDAAGLRVAEQLRRVRKQRRLKTARSSSVRIFLGETAPENLTGQIKKFRPTHLVILDAADARRKKPGSITLVRHDLLRGGSSISTHNLPVNILVQYIRQSVPCKVLILGIQPESHEFGRPLSAPVRKAARLAAEALAAALHEIISPKPEAAPIPKLPGFHGGGLRVNVADRNASCDVMDH
jgi:hydrogenase 3 maturation protease